MLLAFRGRYFVVRRDAGVFLVDIKNHIERRIEAFGNYEAAQLSYFFRVGTQVQPTMIIDIGANTGLYSIQSARRFPRCEVLAFEPDLRNRAQLMANLFLNEMQDRVRVQDLALSDKAGITSFHRFSDENRGRSSIQSGGEYMVRRACLDNLVKLKGETIMLKIDVEGHELEVLRGAKDLLFSNKCALQIESTEREDMLVDFFSLLNYRKFACIGHDKYFTNISFLWNGHENLCHFHPQVPGAPEAHSQSFAERDAP